MKFVFWGILTFFAQAHAESPSAALHLITYQPWGFTVDASPQGERMRQVLQKSQQLGFKTVVFNFRGHMVTGKGNEVRPTVEPAFQANEEKYILETASYAKSLGLQVAFRPILLVVGPKGEFPYVENHKIYWWHGNIKPRDPKAWFESYFKFHERYMRLAAQAGAEWYSVGAEMQSMTVGQGDRDPSWRLGFPKSWIALIQKARTILGPQTKITYGINYTDQYVLANKQKVWGGEIEQWKYYLTEDFKAASNIQHQKDMRALWNQLDIIGIDYYRALASEKEKFSTDFEKLATQLQSRPESHASQLDTILTEIAITVGEEKPLFFQEVGYRSVEKSFLSPAAYESKGGDYNSLHQAAAWEAFFRAYWAPQWPWMTGVAMWQVLVDENTDPAKDTGFTPMAKPVESVLRRYLKP